MHTVLGKKNLNPLVYTFARQSPVKGDFSHVTLVPLVDSVFKFRKCTLFLVWKILLHWCTPFLDKVWWKAFFYMKPVPLVDSIFQFPRCTLFLVRKILLHWRTPFLDKVWWIRYSIYFTVRVVEPLSCLKFLLILQSSEHKHRQYFPETELDISEFISFL